MPESKSEKAVIHGEGKWFIQMIEFQQFWNEYPRKVGKHVARQKWQRLTEDQRGRAIHGVRLWKCTAQWASSGGEFVPYASTFLNQERWNDEPWNGAFEQYPYRGIESQGRLFGVREAS